MKRKTSAEVIANHLTWDITDVRDNRYHYGRTSIPVFTAGQNFYCATKEGKKPAKYRDDSIEWEWVECPPNQLNAGWTVWKSTNK